MNLGHKIRLARVLAISETLRKDDDLSFTILLQSLTSLKNSK